MLSEFMVVPTPRLPKAPGKCGLKTELLSVAFKALGQLTQIHLSRHSPT